MCRWLWCLLICMCRLFTPQWQVLCVWGFLAFSLFIVMLLHWFFILWLANYRTDWYACCEGLGTQQWCSNSIFHTVFSSQTGAFQMFFFSFPLRLLFTGGSLSAFFPCSCPPWHSATWATHSGQERPPCDSNGYRWSLRMAPILVHMLLEGVSFWCSCDEVGGLKTSIGMLLVPFTFLD